MISDYFPLDPRVYVRSELELRQKRRPQYSMRAFARDLEISPSFLCEFLAGRQGLSRARTLWIAEKIKLSDMQTEHFWDLLQSQFGFPESAKKAAATRALDRARSPRSHLESDRFRQISEWYCFPLLEILSLKDGPKTAAEIAPLLGVPEDELQRAMQRLCGLGLLSTRQMDGQAIFEAASELTTVGDEIDNCTVQAAHQQTLRVHAAFAGNKPFAERENLSAAFSINQSDWSALRADLQKALVDVISKYANAASEKNQVVALTFQAVTLLPENK